MFETNQISSNDNTETTKETTVQQTQTTHPETTDLSIIAANLAIVKEQAQELEHQIEDLEARFKLARGTGDVTEQAEAAVVEPKPAKPAVPRVVHGPRMRRPVEPRVQVERALRGNSLNAPQIAKATGLPVGKVTEIVRTLREERKIANVGTEDFPRWTLRIGDRTSTQELNAEVKRLVTERPMTTQELIDVTGARLSRVSGALINLQRTENQLLNLGTQRRAKWLLVGDRAVVSRLSPKG